MRIPFVIVTVLILCPKIWAQQFDEIRFDTTQILLTQSEKALVAAANSRGIPLNYTLNRERTISAEKSFEAEKNQGAKSEIILQNRNYLRQSLANLILNKGATRDEINEAIELYNLGSYLEEACLKDYGTVSILLADIHSSYGGYSDEYLDKHWRTRRNYEEASEDSEVAFFVIRWIASNLTLILSPIILVLVIRNLYRRRRKKIRE